MERFCPYCLSLVRSGALCSHCGKDPAAYQPSSHHFPLGGLLKERYLVGRVLGEGGFGITYLGMDTNLERRVAIKEYFPTTFVKREVSITTDVTCLTANNQDLYEKGRERFLLEARTMAKLDNIPGIVQVLDFFPANNTAYIVMEFLEGRTLKELTAQQGCIPAKDMLEILEPVLKAMESMHAAGIIHRDVSPDNLMVLKSGEMKLMDFGCARDIDSGHTMTTMLKHGFAPREQYSGHDQGAWTDVYALCATVYYCLTGKVPPSSIMRVDGSGDPLIAPTKLGATLSPALESALLKGLAVRAKDRWQSAGDLYAALYGRTIAGEPWTPPSEEAKKTEYIYSGENNGPAQETSDLNKTEFAPDDKGTGDSSVGNEGTQSQASSLLTRWKGLSKQVKIVAGSAACLAVILSAALALGNPSPNVPAANIGSDIQQEETTSSNHEKDSDVAPEDTLDGTDKLPGITDSQPAPSESEDPAPGESDHPDTEPNTQTGGNAQNTTQPEKPNTPSGNPGTPASQSQGTPAKTEPEPTPAPTPTKAELEAEAEAARDSGLYTQSAAVYKEMNEYGYVSNSKLGFVLYELGLDAESAGDLQAAYDLYTQSANLGCAPGMYCLGYMYASGQYVSQDQAKAVQWWEKAGAIDADYYYWPGLYYARGQGVSQDITKAISYLEKCVAANGFNSLDAQALLNELQGS